jgi:hypothetical protein
MGSVWGGVGGRGGHAAAPHLGLAHLLGGVQQQVNRQLTQTLIHVHIELGPPKKHNTGTSRTRGYGWCVWRGGGVTSTRVVWVGRPRECAAAAHGGPAPVQRALPVTTRTSSYILHTKHNVSRTRSRGAGGNGAGRGVRHSNRSGGKRAQKQAPQKRRAGWGGARGGRASAASPEGGVHHMPNGAEQRL